MAKEFELPRQIRETIARTPRDRRQSTVVFDTASRANTRVLDYIAKQESSLLTVNYEGSPIYLWPHPDRPTQAWDNRAFIGGHEYVVHLATDLPPEIVSHAVMLDEFNGRSPDAGEDAFQQQLIRLYESSSVIAISPIFDDVAHPHTRRYLESSFVQDGEQNYCSTLDSAFQREKILGLLNYDGANYISREQLSLLHDMRIVIVHPSSFQRQQLLMLHSLLSDMKKPPFDQISKRERQQVISDLYRHIWLDDTTGQVKAVTQPVWDENKFVFKEVVDL